MKRIFILIFSIIAIFLFSFTAYCVDTAEEIKSDISDRFFGSLDSEVNDILEDNGLDTLDSEKIFSSGAENIAKFFSETLKDKLKGAAGWFFLLLCILMILSVVSSAFDFSSSGDGFSLLCVIIICIVTVEKISYFVNCTVSAVMLNGKLMLSFIPVFTLLISLSGNPSGALTYSSFLLFFCELMSAFISELFISLVGMYFALSLSFSFNANVNLNRFVNSVNRVVNLILGFSASMFTGFLSLKNILAYSTDSLSVKGVKFLLGSLVPVIGSSLSEAYSTVLASINLMKGSLGVLGIFAVTLINIPALTEGVIYYVMMALLSCFAEILGLYRASETLRCLSSCVKILLLICLFQVFILIISTGIMLSLKGGVNG